MISLLAAIFTDCFGQEITPHEKNLINLTYPKITKEDIASPQDLKHCIDLTHKNYLIIINSKRYVCSNEQKIVALLKKNRKEVVTKRLSIIYDSATSPERVVKVLDILTEQNIRSYKLAVTDEKSILAIRNLANENRQSKSVDFSDSTFLIVSIENACLKASLLSNKMNCKKIEDLDSFIVAQKKCIDPYKVLIVAEKDLAYKDIRPVIDLLSKYEYHNFRMITKD